MKRLLFVTLLLFFFVHMVKDDPLKLTADSCNNSCQSIALAKLTEIQTSDTKYDVVSINPSFNCNDTIDVKVDQDGEDEYAESMSQSSKTSDYTVSALITKKEMAGYFIQPKSDLTP